MAAEADTSRTPSPDKSLTSLLRRGSRRDSRASSFVSGESGEGATSNRRNSLKVGLDRLKDSTSRRSSDLDARSGGSPSRLSRMVRSKPRQKSKDGEQSINNGDRDTEKSTRGRISRRLGIGQSNAEEDGSLQVAGAGNSKLNVNASTDSLGGGRSAASSLLTEDSEPDVSPSRPQFVSRQSHKGLLTFNSPLIAAETVPFTSNESETTANASETPATAVTAAAAADGSAPSAVTLSSEPGPTSVASTPQSDLSDKKQKVVAKTSPSRSGTATPRPPKSARITISPISTSTTTLPATLITPPTPRLDREPSPPKKAATAVGTLSTKSSAVPAKDVVHRRTRSAVTSSTSRLSSQVDPLTPTAEEAKTPGGSVITPSGSSGFFSSVFSATNNAITQISNTFQISGGPNQRARSGTSASEPDKAAGVGKEEVILHSRAQTRDGPVPVEPAVKTLGSGNLSLSHLGISDSLQESSPMSSQPDLAPGSGHSPPIPSSPGERDNVPVAAATAAAAIDAAYNDKTGPQVVNDSVPPSARPLSISSAVNSIPGDQTPPRRDTLADSSGVQRSGSVRSRFSGRRKKRSRGSSTATGSAIAAALAQSSSALVNPTLGPQRTTGFAVASSKRNKDFHALFKSVPEDDYLIEDYSAALQRDILLHGRMYVSERHICFSSNILGWQTNLVMNFDEVVAMEKKSTAMIFPNAIVIQTLHAKNVFASFLSRDPTYDLLIGIWKIGHPNLKSSDNGHVLDDQAKSELAESVDGDDDEDDESDYSGETRSSGLGSIVESAYDVHGGDPAEATRLVSTKLSKPDSGNGGSGNGSSPTKSAELSPPAATDSPGPATHAPTECADQDSHYDKELVDTTIPAPLGAVYDMMFGPKSGVVMRKFLVDDQSSRELDLDDDKTGMGDSVKSSSYSYIKPLNSSIGPKQTKCIVNQTLDAFDLEKAVSVTCSTQTPDVPSGNVFVTKTKYCLMWGPGNSTRFIMNFTVEWSGKSWIKGPIEKGAFDGQTQYGKDIVRFMTAQVSSRSSKTPRAGGKVKGKKRSRTDGSTEMSKNHSKSASANNQSGGVLSMLGPVGDIVGPLMTPVVALSIMLLLVTTLWLRAGRDSSTARQDFGTQVRNYEDLWWREENQLWDWLEDRLELEDIATPLKSSSKGRKATIKAATQGSYKEVRDEKQLDEAIRVTEERLSALKRSRGM